MREFRQRAEDLARNIAEAAWMREAEKSGADLALSQRMFAEFWRSVMKGTK